MNTMPSLPVSQRRRSDLVSLATGLMVFGIGFLLSGVLSASHRPGILVLLSLSVAAAATGAASVLLAGRRDSDTGWQAARLGARTGLFSSALSAGMMVLASKLGGADGLFSIWLSAALCILPGALAGMAGTSMGLKLSTTPPPGTEPSGKPLTAPMTGGISWLALPIWGLAAFGMSSPLYLRTWRGYFPPPPLKIEAPVPPPKPVERPAPVTPPPPPPPRFEFVPSAELATTEALRWELFTRKPLPEISGDSPLALSRDGRRLAGMSGESVVLVDLHTLETTCRWHPSRKVQSLAFSPDAADLFFVTDDSPAAVGVLRVAGARVIPLPQPRKRLVPDTPPLWQEENTVHFLSTGGVPLNLSLDSLEIDSITSEETWRAKPASERDKWTMQGQPVWLETSTWALTPQRYTIATELPEVEGVRSGWPARSGFALGVAGKNGVASVFPQVDVEIGDRFLASADGSKFIRCRGSSAEIFYFRPSSGDSRVVWRAKMPYASDLLEDLLVKRAAEEKRLCAYVYPPLTNPLNQKIIGPDRSRVLAAARLIEWNDTDAVFEKAQHTTAHSQTVILADPHLWNGSEPQLVSFSTPHRWWAETELAPNPSPGVNLPPLHNQPRVETRLEGGAMRITDLREPDVQPPPSQPDSTPQLPEPLPRSSRPANDSEEPAIPLTPEARAVGEFLVKHHQKATAGDISGLAADYADRVQYLTKGTVDRAFIEKDESQYHRDNTSVQEEIRGGIQILKTGERRYSARYKLHSTTTSRKDGSTSSREVPLLLEVEFIGGQPRIVRQVQDK